jgi:hypothetical protein
MTAALIYGTFTEWKYNAFDGGPTATGEAYPLPSVNWTTSRERNGAGTLLSEEINVSIKGIVTLSGLVDHANSQNITTFDYLIERSKFLQDQIFNNDNKIFVFKFGDKDMIKGEASVQSLQFSPNENNWTTSIDYSLELNIPITGTGSLFYDGNEPTLHITSCDDSFSIQQEDRRDSNGHNLYRLDRSISATAKAYAEMESGSLTYAKAWVQKKADNLSIGAIANLTNFGLYNRTRNIDLSETDGTYSIRDSFLLKSGDPWIYNDSVDISVTKDNLRTITINGEVEGLCPMTGGISLVTTAANASGQLDISGIAPKQTFHKGNAVVGVEEGEEAEGDTQKVTKYENAISGYQALETDGYFFERALSFDNMAKAMISTNRPLHGIPVSIDEGLSPQQGKVTFSRAYDSRPTGLLKGTLFESFTFSDTAPKALISPVPVIGRRLGPLYYNKQGYSNISTMKFAQGKGTRSITYEAFFPRGTGLPKFKFPQEIINKIDTYLHLYAPADPYTGFITIDTQDLNLTENKLTKTITWEYVECDA